jgi:hypothetical protein
MDRIELTANQDSYVISNDSNAQIYFSTDYTTTTASTLNISSPLDIVTPVSFTFQDKSWKYTLAFALTALFAPWLIIWSKIIGRETGFRVLNPSTQPILGTGILGSGSFAGYSGPVMDGTLHGISSTTPVQERDFDE